MREFDRNGDGLVDYHEMLKACGCWDPARAASSNAASARRPAAEDWAWSSRSAYAAPAVSAAIGLLCDELRSRGEEAWRVLRRLDSNGSGTISRSEMARGLREIGLTLRAGAPLPAHCLRRRLRLTCAASFDGRPTSLAAGSWVSRFWLAEPSALLRR